MNRLILTIVCILSFAGYSCSPDSVAPKEKEVGADVNNDAHLFPPTPICKLIHNFNIVGDFGGVTVCNELGNVDIGHNPELLVVRADMVASVTGLYVHWGEPTFMGSDGLPDLNAFNVQVVNQPDNSGLIPPVAKAEIPLGNLTEEVNFYVYITMDLGMEVGLWGFGDSRHIDAQITDLSTANDPVAMPSCPAAYAPPYSIGWKMRMCDPIDADGDGVYSAAEYNGGFGEALWQSGCQPPSGYDQPAIDEIGDGPEEEYPDWYNPLNPKITQFTICHIPPGDPTNIQIMKLADYSLAAHIMELKPDNDPCFGHHSGCHFGNCDPCGEGSTLESAGDRWDPGCVNVY